MKSKLYLKFFDDFYVYFRFLYRVIGRPVRALGGEETSLSGGWHPRLRILWPFRSKRNFSFFIIVGTAQLRSTKPARLIDTVSALQAALEGATPKSATLRSIVHYIQHVCSLIYYLPFGLFIYSCWVSVSTWGTPRTLSVWCGSMKASGIRTSKLKNAIKKPIIA